MCNCRKLSVVVRPLTRALLTDKFVTHCDKPTLILGFLKSDLGTQQEPTAVTYPVIINGVDVVAVNQKRFSQVAQLCLRDQSNGSYDGVHIDLVYVLESKFFVQGRITLFSDLPADLEVFLLAVEWLD